MKYIYEQLSIIILRNSIRGTRFKIVNSILLGKGSNHDPDCYRENLIKIDNNDNTSSSKTIEDRSCKLGNSSLFHIFRWKSKKCQFLGFAFR